MAAIISRARKAYYGWRVLGASCLLSSIGIGLTNYGFSVFFLPIQESLALSRTATSLVFSLSRSEGAIEGPLAGWAIDKWGPRKIVFIGSLMMGIGYLLLARVDSFLSFLIVYMGIISIGFNAGIVHAPFAVANSWFVRKRGLASGILAAALGIGGAIIPPALSFLIIRYGWQTTAFLSGIVVLAFVVPLSFFFRRSPESMGLLPDGDTERVTTAIEQEQAAPRNEVDFSAGQAMRTVAFWMLTVAMSLRLAAIIGIIVHFVPLMVWKGTDEPMAAVLLGSMALLGVPVRIFLGWAGDRMSRNVISGIGCLIGTLAMIFLINAKPGWQLWFFVVIYTIPDSVGIMSWSIVADYFGRKRFASIRGIMTAFTGVAGAVMPVVAGWLYDRTQDYNTTIWILLVILTLSGAVFFLLRPPRHSIQVSNHSQSTSHKTG